MKTELLKRLKKHDAKLISVAAGSVKVTYTVKGVPTASYNVDVCTRSLILTMIENIWGTAFAENIEEINSINRLAFSRKKHGGILYKFNKKNEDEVTKEDQKEDNGD